MTNTSPERKNELLAMLPTLARPDPKTLSSLDRLLRVNLYREAIQAGIEVPAEHLAYGVELISVDRADRASAASQDRKLAKAAGAAKPITDALDL